MGHLRNDKIYTGNRRLKKSQKAGQKQTPQEFCGDLFIPGGRKDIRTSDFFGRVRNVSNFTATLHIIFFPTQKPIFRQSAHIQKQLI